MNIMEQVRAHLNSKGESPAPPSTEANASARLLPNLVCLADVTPEPIHWLWPKRLALGKLSLLAGRPGLGKSFLTCDLAARISTGRPWPCSLDSAPVGDVLLIAGEDDPSDTIRPRLDALQANVQRIHILKAGTRIDSNGQISTLSFDLSHLQLIADSLQKLPACKLVIIDPIGSYLGGQLDVYRENEVRAVLTPLASLAAEKAVAILLVAHPPKSISGHADDNVLGSRAFTGIVRTVFHLIPDKDNPKRRLLLAGKTNLSAQADGLAFTIDGLPPQLLWENDSLGDYNADDAYFSSSPVRSAGGDKFQQACLWLQQFLANGPQPVNHIQEQALQFGHSFRTLRRAKDQLGISTYKLSFSGAWMWKLPLDELPTDEADTLDQNEQEDHLLEEDQDDQGGQQSGCQPVSPTVGHLRGSSSERPLFPEDDQGGQGDQESGCRSFSPTVGHLRGSSSEKPFFPEDDQEDQEDQEDQGGHLDHEDFLPECETSDHLNDAFQNGTPLGGESEWIC